LEVLSAKKLAKLWLKEKPLVAKGKDDEDLRYSNMFTVYKNSLYFMAFWKLNILYERNIVYNVIITQFV